MDNKNDKNDSIIDRWINWDYENCPMLGKACIYAESLKIEDKDVSTEDFDEDVGIKDSNFENEKERIINKLHEINPTFTKETLDLFRAYISVCGCDRCNYEKLKKDLEGIDIQNLILQKLRNFK